MENRYSLQMAFLDPSHSFVHGYECGRLWELMSRGEPIEQNVHTANAEQIALMAKYHDYKFDLKEYPLSEDPDGTYRWMIGAPGPKIQ